jgi:hypothetical protein
VYVCWLRVVCVVKVSVDACVVVGVGCVVCVVGRGGVEGE